MIKELVEAISNRGKSNEEKTEQEFDIPESISEAIELLKGEEEVFKHFLASYKVGLQNSIRKPPPKKITSVLAAFKRLIHLVDAGTITMDQARKIGQYFGPWPIEEETKETKEREEESKEREEETKETNLHNETHWNRANQM